MREHMNYLNREIKKVRDQIADLIDQNPNLRQKNDLLVSIPGIGKTTITVILSELDNLEKFNPVRELVASIRLAPKETLSPGYSIKGRPGLCKIMYASGRISICQHWYRCNRF
jgi:transposase